MRIEFRNIDLARVQPDSLEKSLNVMAENRLDPGIDVNFLAMQKGSVVVPHITKQGYNKILNSVPGLIWNEPRAIYVWDEYEVELGGNPKIVHKPRDPEGAHKTAMEQNRVTPDMVYGFYMSYKMEGGSWQFLYMSRSEMLRRRAIIGKGSPGFAWENYFDRMGCLTIKREKGKQVIGDHRMKHLMDQNLGYVSDSAGNPIRVDAGAQLPQVSPPDPFGGFKADPTATKPETPKASTPTAPQAPKPEPAKPQAGSGSDDPPPTHWDDNEVPAGGTRRPRKVNY